MKFRRQKMDEVNINLTPLIDVVFLLLIFFMVTTTFKQSTELTIDLPTATSSDPVTVSNEQIEVVITSDGQYVINGLTLINGRADTLKLGLDEASEGNNQLPLIITADANSSYEMVMKVYDAATQLGFTKLAHTAERETAQ
ncbi:ExbD/TolR family protein [Marinomonas sp. 2405UD68-3]|uniref:ExbD/TolR family protein n=1 Tax=Marinomonas sp. 2405UD68-3 TaxID=3391835 RepID=UPI0039C969CA